MNRKFPLVLFFVLSFQIYAQSEPDQHLVQEEKTYNQPQENSQLNHSLLLKFSYFYPSAQKFRDLYSSGLSYGLKYNSKVRRHFSLWAEVDFFSKKGKTIPSSSCGYPTRITLIPLSTGLKFVYQKELFVPYIGAGVEVTWMQVHTRSPFLVHKNSKWGIGGVFKAGVLLIPYSDFVLDFFIDYSLLTIKLAKPNHHPFVQVSKSNLDHFNFGTALGISF